MDQKKRRYTPEQWEQKQTTRKLYYEEARKRWHKRKKARLIARIEKKKSRPCPCCGQYPGETAWY
jgi:hypothetical protein